MLQELLNLGLVDIGSDDSRFTKMESAATQLARRFVESPSLLIAATLIALDENIEENEPFFDLVEDLVIAEWNTLRNTHVNRPRQLLRSIAISALTSAVHEDAERSAIVWNTAASRLLHDQTSLGKTSVLLTQQLEVAYSTAEREALRRAGMVVVTPKKERRKAPASSAPAAPSLSGSIENEDVLQDIARAAGPKLPEYPEIDDPNPHWPNQQPPHWPQGFTPRMAEALVKAVNLGTARLAESITIELATHITAMEGHLEKALRQVESLQAKLAKSEAARRMRLDVLWWSQARYSPSQKAAYSTLSCASVALVAAIDLTAMVPPLAPASVTHVLGETVAACTGDKRQSVLKHLEELKESSSLIELDNILSRGDAKEVRVPLLAVAAEAANGSIVSEHDLRVRAGVEPELMLEPADFAMWLFREIQARRIAEGAA